MKNIITCRICKKEFAVANWDKERKYCSITCRGLGTRKRVEKTCLVCGKKWEQQASDTTTHCSRQCRGLADRARLVGQCRHCGKDIEKTAGVNRQFCNRDCFHASQQKPSGHRRCTKCGVVKHPDKFANPSWCKACAGTAHKASVEKPVGRHKYAVNEARRRGLDWTLTMEEHLALLAKSCHYCKGPLNSRGVGLDRIDNNEGYLIDNVVPCCGRCNRVRHDYFTFDEMKVLGETILLLESKRATG